jgi:hypothetical protein
LGLAKLGNAIVIGRAGNIITSMWWEWYTFGLSAQSSVGSGRRSNITG